MKLRDVREGRPFTLGKGCGVLNADYVFALLILFLVHTYV